MRLPVGVLRGELGETGEGEIVKRVEKWKKAGELCGGCCLEQKQGWKKKRFATLTGLVQNRRIEG